MTEDWIWLWFSYFKLNKQYQKYCEAQRKGNAATIKRLEKRFPNITELYADWGDIHSFDPREADKQHYKDWRSKRRHLFYNATLAPAAVLKTPPTSFDRNYLYVRVPITKNAADATKQATTVVRKALQTTKMKQQRTRGTAKYFISKTLMNDRTLHGTRKALNVWEMFNNVSGKKPTVMEVVKKIEQRLKNPRHSTWSNYWGWNRGVRKIAGNDNSVARMVKRYRAEAAAIIENTMHGQFPSKAKLK